MSVSISGTTASPDGQEAASSVRSVPDGVSQTEEVLESPPLEYVINTGGGYDTYNRLLDITGKRLEEMDENGVAVQVISVTAAGLQNLRDRSVSGQVRKAAEVNDYAYSRIRSHPSRFRAFAALPMRDPASAARELERCVRRLGFVGALVNGSDILYYGSRNRVLFYDTPEYDVLWAKFVELDVPLYLHPTVYPSIQDHVPDPFLQGFYAEYPALTASAWGFSAYLAQHVLRLVISGVFDRFPRFQLILGHMGEMLPWWAERFDHRLRVYKDELRRIGPSAFHRHGLPRFVLPKKTLSEYLRTNIRITTSGWFSNDALEYVIRKMGVDRVMFSIDYPYEQQKTACEWMDSVPLSQEEKEKIAYRNAARLLKIR